jgi:hypothetical protein
LLYIIKFYPFDRLGAGYWTLATVAWIAGDEKICFPVHFSLAHLAVAVYIPHRDNFPIFEPDVKALRRARHRRDTDGDGVCPARGRIEVRRVRCEE